MLTATPLDELLDLCCTEIGRRAHLAGAEPSMLAKGAAAFRAALDAGPVVPSSPAGALATVPVVAELQHLSASPIEQAAVAAAREIPWIPSPRVKDSGTDVALGIVNDVRDLGTLTCGLMLLAPGAVYPEHAHPPQEIYLPISGSGRWRYGGDNEYRSAGGDSLIYNYPRGLHGTIAGSEPLLALYILWP